MDEEEGTTVTDTSNDIVIKLDDPYHAAMDYNGILDTITITGDTSSSTYAASSAAYGGNMAASTITWSPSTLTLPANGTGGYYSTISLAGNGSISSSYAAPNAWVFGDTDSSKNKIYIVEPWQSRNPIKVEDGLWVSLEKDLISNNELKQKIMDRLEETNPEILIKMGINKDNMKLVKREVNIEIKPDEKDEK